MTNGNQIIDELKLLKSELDCNATVDSVQHALTYLNVAINDFPIDFFLQSPYICKSLIALVASTKCDFFQDVIVTFTQMIRALQKRVKMKQRKSSYCWEQKDEVNRSAQTEISQFCYDGFVMAFDYLNQTMASLNQNKLNDLNNLIIDLIYLVQCEKDVNFPFEEILNSLGLLTKNMRKINETNQLPNRNQYMLFLYFLNKMAKIKQATVHKVAYNESCSAIKACDDFENLSLRKATDNSCDVCSLFARIIWLNELQFALFDFALQHQYAELYQQIFNVIKQNYSCEHNLIFPKLLTQTVGQLLPVVNLLQNQHECDTKETISMASVVLDTFFLHKSLDLIRIIFNALMAQYSQRNSDIETNCDQLFLRLLAIDNLDVKRLIYKLSADNMKHYFNGLLNLKKPPNNDRFIGIPLSTNILIEIICFGYRNTDNCILENAEIILTILLKSETVLQSMWANAFEVIVPCMPLLQCFASRSSLFGNLIVDQLNPDNWDDTNELIQLSILKGNLALLFNKQPNVRQEAIDRLSYILLNKKNCCPSVITDTIPNSICTIDGFKRRLNKGVSAELSCNIHLMIDLFKNGDRSVKKSTLINLNIMAEDAFVSKLLYTNIGFDLVLNVLENSLEQKDCVDSAMPAIGIISKWCLQFTEFRRELSREPKICYLLLKALFLFHQNDSFREDCSIALFMLLFGEFTIGTCKISLPVICSNLNVPFECIHHWQHSPFILSSNLEIMFKQNSFGNDKIECIWQFIRLEFATIWLNGYENIIKNIETLENNELSMYFTKDKALKFDKQLYLTQADLKIVKATEVQTALKYWLRKITNATAHQDIRRGIYGISNVILHPYVGVDKPEMLLIFNEMSYVLRRFFLTLPTSEADQQLLIDLMQFVGDVIEKDFTNIHNWILEELQKSDCICIRILVDIQKFPFKLSTAVCRFFYTIFKKSVLIEKRCKTSDNFSTEIIKNSSHVYDKMLNDLVLTLDTVYGKRDMYLLIYLLKMLKIITSSKTVQLSKDFCNQMTIKLFDYIAKMKSFAQNHAVFVKICLIIICNLSTTIDRQIIMNKHLKLLSGLCGHFDHEIRTYAWNVLAELSQNVSGATKLIQALSFLPGGFHACCINTLLDPHEISTVRETAGFLFYNLLKHINCHKHFNASVSPICLDNTEISLYVNTPDAIIELVKFQKYFQNLHKSLSSYNNCSELIDAPDKEAITCDFIRSNCMILTNLIVFNSSIVDELQENGIILKFIRIMETTELTTSSIAMLTHICNFLTLCFYHKSATINLIYENAAIDTLIHFLDLTVYDSFTEDLKLNALNEILLTLTYLIKGSHGLQFILTIIHRNQFQQILNLILFVLQYNRNEELLVNILKFTSTLLLLIQSADNQIQQFAIIFDLIKVRAVKNKLAENCSSSDLIYFFLFELFKSKKENWKLFSSIGKTMGLLLKYSPSVRLLALKNGLLSYILKQIDTTLDKLELPCRVFLRKCKDFKARQLNLKIKLYFEIILNWYSNCDCSADDELNIKNLCLITFKMWPFSNFDYDTQIIVIKTCTVLSEDSLQVCQIFSSFTGGNSAQSMLQLFIQNIVGEISKSKIHQSKLLSLQFAFRIIINCCSCIQGRMLLDKSNILSIFDQFHSAASKQDKSWNFLLFWSLQFYQVLSRYSDGTIKRYLPLLCSIAMKQTKVIRLEALKILRNMAFIPSNRSEFLLSDDFFNVSKNILDSAAGVTRAEQFLVILTLWKITANCYKAKHVIRTSSILEKLTILNDEIDRTIRQPSENKLDSTFNETLGILIQILNK